MSLLTTLKENHHKWLATATVATPATLSSQNHQSVAVASPVDTHTIQLLDDFVSDAVLDLNVSPQRVINELLDTDDKRYIIEGLASPQWLHACVKTWIADGMPYYSDKSGERNE